MNDRTVAGVDEAGRGPLAGSVVAAAVILNPRQTIESLADSKKLSAAKREALYPVIRESALAFCIAEASVEEIEELNILGATMLAMQRAVAGLELKPVLARIDGNRAPNLGTIATETIIGGDAIDPAISAASILAKVYRDAQMTELDARYPGYGFAKHKGYPTAEHRAALERLGPSPVHRSTYRPVRQSQLF